MFNRKKQTAVVALPTQASVALMSVNACQMLQGLIFPRTPNDFQWANYYVSV